MCVSEDRKNRRDRRGEDAKDKEGRRNPAGENIRTDPFHRSAVTEISPLSRSQHLFLSALLVCTKRRSRKTPKLLYLFIYSFIHSFRLRWKRWYAGKKKKSNKVRWVSVST